MPARSVNSAQVLANWLVGREIFIEQQEGRERAVYGEKVVPELAKRMKARKIKGYGATNLKLCRQFHLEYPDFLHGRISHALCDQFSLQPILHAPCGESSATSEPILHALRGESQNGPATNDLAIGHALSDQFKPGHFTPNISWTHYRTILKCYVLVDLKIGKLTHEDLGQLQLYVNYYDRERRAQDDNPTLGLILATEKNDSMVRYTLAEGQQSIFTSRYQLHLPTEAELQAELLRELHNLS